MSKRNYCPDLNLSFGYITVPGGKTSALASYQTGSLDFLSLLDSERLLLNFRLAYAKERANYRQQVVSLERATGGSFF